MFCLLHSSHRFLFREQMINDVFMTFRINSGSRLFRHSLALLRDVRLLGEHCRISCGGASLTPRLAIVFNIHLVNIECPELICDLLLTTFSNQQLAFSVEDNPFTDTLLAFVRISVNFPIWEATSSYYLQYVGEVFCRNSIVTRSVHHLPQLFE